MYAFRLWFATERAAIAKEELEPYRQAELAKRGFTATRRDLINKAFDKGELTVAHNIHPLCLLGLRRKITN